MRYEGYRYVRAYQRLSGEWNWALWEVRDGTKKHIGTARTEEEYVTYLRGDPQSLKERITEKCNERA